MEPIRRLPPTLVNRIAAGEVVERPAAVVKELVENAVDATATRVEIDLENAGRSLIRVRDDGHGMAPEALPLALERHATSKLASDNLLDLRFLGFRGEALPSIAAVSRLTLTSRTAAAEHGWTIEVAAGAVREPRPAAASLGTDVAVRDLFDATPARLKFLRSDRAELQAAGDIVRRLALAHPNVTLRLRHDGRAMFDALPGDRGDRARAVLGAALDDALHVTAARDGVALEAFCALPTAAARTARHQFLIVNGRPVSDRLLVGALRGAFADLLPHDRHAVAVVYLDVAPEAVDVNVHPAKAEVRFRDAGAVRGLIVGAVKRGLADAGKSTARTVSAAALGSFRPGGTVPPRRTDAWHPSVRPQLTLAEPRPPWQAATDASATPSPLSDEMPAQAHDDADVETAAERPLGRPRAQVHGTYIVAEAIDGLVLVDMHAAHERIVYEGLKKALAEGVTRQALLVPEVVELAPTEVAQLLAAAPALLRLGLEIEAFGKGAVLVRAVPAPLGLVEAAPLLRDLVDDLVDGVDPAGLEGSSLEERLLALAARIACHGSVRGGQKLTPEAMTALLRTMEATPNSGQCNHGRPTYVKLTRDDLERLFARR